MIQTWKYLIDIKIMRKLCGQQIDSISCFGFDAVMVYSSLFTLHDSWNSIWRKNCEMTMISWGSDVVTMMMVPILTVLLALIFGSSGKALQIEGAGRKSKLTFKLLITLWFKEPHLDQLRCGYLETSRGALSWWPSWKKYLMTSWILCSWFWKEIPVIMEVRHRRTVLDWLILTSEAMRSS